MMTGKKLSALLLAGALALGLLAGCGGEAPSSRPPEETPPEQTAGSGPEESVQPDLEGTAAALGSLASFTGYTLDGETFTQEDIAAKDVTVVNFWALTCGPCIVEMPDLAQYAKALPDNVQVITVCLDGYGSEAATRQVLQDAGFEGVTLIAGDGDLQTLCGNLLYTPTTVFADSEGRLVGDEIIGRQQDLTQSYTAAVNRVLRAGGKAEISVESE